MFDACVCVVVTPSCFAARYSCASSINGANNRLANFYWKLESVSTDAQAEGKCAQACFDKNNCNYAMLTVVRCRGRWCWWWLVSWLRTDQD